MKLRVYTGWLAVLALCAVLLLPPLYVAPVPTVQAAVSASSRQQTTGDVSLDGLVDIVDVMVLYGHVSGETMLSVAQLRNSEINGDGVVDTMDVMALYGVVSGESSLTTSPSQSTTISSAVTTTTTTTYTMPSAVPTTPSTTVTTGATAVLGMDISYAQGTIDWQAVSETEVEFAIIRCGYGQDEDGQDDTKWEENAAACEEYGIPYGAYFFCYARTPEEAYGEALHALRLLEGKNLTLPIFYDMEYSKWQGNLTPDEYAAIATVFCDTLAQHGYLVGVYTNLDWWRNRLTNECFDRWYRWVAQYNETCDYEGTYHIWQYTDDGEVDGITVNTVDMNYCYADFKGLTAAAVPDGSA